MENLYNQAAKIIKAADALLIGAGAGIGVDSGLPDFRGTSGFWRAYPPIAKLGLKFEEMANPIWFEDNPKLAWAFYGHRYNLYKEITPHKGFDILLEIAKSMKNGYFVYTSNVDGQFQKAGFENDRIYEIHGSISHLQCVNNCNNNIWKADFEKVNIDEEKFEAVGELPKCPKCKNIARPNILMFGDWGWIDFRASKQAENYNKWLSELYNKKSKIAIIEMGAGKSIPSVRLNSQKIVRQLTKAKLIRINPREYDVPQGEIGLPVGALEGVVKIAEKL